MCLPLLAPSTAPPPAPPHPQYCNCDKTALAFMKSYFNDMDTFMKLYKVLAEACEFRAYIGDTCPKDTWPAAKDVC